MNIPLKMNKDFEKAISVMNEKYGEDFEYLNGIHESQLNFSDFIDGFIDKNVADVTIDANANASCKDIRSLLSEKGKSHDKLFAFNKIFYEMKKNKINVIGTVMTFVKKHSVYSKYYYNYYGHKYYYNNYYTNSYYDVEDEEDVENKESVEN